MEESQIERTRELAAEVPRQRVINVTGGDWDEAKADPAKVEADSLKLLNVLVESPVPTRRQIAIVIGSLSTLALLSLLTAPWEALGVDLWIYVGGIALIIGSIVWLLRLDRSSKRYGRLLTGTAFLLNTAANESSPPLLWDLIDDAASILSAHRRFDDALALRLGADAKKLALQSEAVTHIDLTQASAAQRSRAPERSAP